jgi:apolipoprotein D and lipocalin family protein
MRALLIALTLMLPLTAACKGRPLPTVDQVEIERYIGRWYAITSLPQFFTRNCLGQTADYDIINSQTISVLNTCLKAKGTTTIEGQAVVTNAATNAELEVTFDTFWTRLFRVRGDYNVIALDPEYRYVMVGGQDRRSLWIMARESSMPEAVIEQYVARARELGFPVEKLVRSRF